MEVAASFLSPSSDSDEPEFMKKYADFKETGSESTHDGQTSMQSLTHDVIGKNLK